MVKGTVEFIADKILEEALRLDIVSIAASIDPDLKDVAENAFDIGSDIIDTADVGKGVINQAIKFTEGAIKGYSTSEAYEKEYAGNWTSGGEIVGLCVGSVEYWEDQQFESFRIGLVEGFNQNYNATDDMSGFNFGVLLGNMIKEMKLSNPEEVLKRVKLLSLMIQYVVL